MPQFERGFFIPDHEQSARAYLEREQSPLAVASHTGRLLDLYVHDVIPRPKEYIQTATIPYLHNAEVGLDISVQRALLEPQQTVIFFHGDIANRTDDEIKAMEAFGYTLVVFAALPDYAKSPLLPNGFSRRGTLRPPVAVEEFTQRIKELKREVTSVSEGRASGLPPYQRMYHFFQVAQELPLKMPESGREKEEIAQEQFHKLLGDIHVDL